MTLQEMRDAIWRATGTNSSTVTQAEIDQQLNNSYWELQDKVDFREKEDETTITTVIGTRQYDLSSLLTDFDYLLHVTYLDPDSDVWVDIEPTDYQNLKDVLDDNTTSRGYPTQYSRYNSYLYLNPVPDQTYSVNILFKKSLGDVGVSGPGIPSSWHEYVYLGGLYRIFRDVLGEYNRALAIRNERDALVLTASTNKAKERSDYSRAGVSILRQRYP